MAMESIMFPLKVVIFFMTLFCWVPSAHTAECGVGSVSLVQTPNNLKENDNVTLKCAAPHGPSGCSGYRIQWKLNHHNSYNNPRAVITYSSPFPSLSISTMELNGVQSTDSGNISCAFNAAESNTITLRIESNECRTSGNSVQQVGTGHLHENNSYSFTCTFGYNAHCGNAEAFWMLNDHKLTNDRRVTIHIQSNAPGRMISDVNFAPIIFRDSGNLVCVFGSAIIGSIKLNVAAQPEIVISPQSVGVTRGKSVNLTCIISNVKEVDSSQIVFTWCNGSQVIKRNIRTNRSLGRSVLSLYKIDESSEQFSCGATYEKSVDCPLLATSEISIFSEGSSTCKQEISDGLMWMEAAAGTTQKRDCGVGYTGVATRLCSLTGVWQLPSLIDCVNEKISRALDDLDQLQNGDIIGNKTHILDGVLKTMVDTTKTGNVKVNQQLSSGDLSKTTTVLDKMLNIVQTSTSKVTINKSTFVGVIDNILSSNNTNTWSQVNEQADDGSTKILKTVQNFGNVIWKTLAVGDNQTIHKENIVVQISRTKGNILFKSSAEEKVTLNQKIELSLQGDHNYTATLYRTIADILPTGNSTSLEHPSEVLALTVEGFEDSLTNGSNINLQFDLKSLQKKYSINNPFYQCVFWNFSSNGWSDEGCWFDRDHCECNHLTNFAVLMSPAGQLNEEDTARLKIISFVGCIVSITFTVVTMLIYFVLWRFRNFTNDRNKTLMNICTALTAAYVVFIVGIDKTNNSIACNAVTFLLHYFFLSTFCLMLAQIVSLLLAVTEVFKTSSKLKWLLLFGWGAPLITVAVTIGVTFNSQYHANNYCWLTPSNGVLYSFVGPVIGIILTNVLIFIYVLRVLFSIQLSKNKSKMGNFKTGIRNVCIFLPVIGLSWLFGILSLNDDLVIFQYLFAIFNSLEGLFIFFAYVIFDKPVREIICDKLKRNKNRTRTTDMTTTRGQLKSRTAPYSEYSSKSISDF